MKLLVKISTLLKPEHLVLLLLFNIHYSLFNLTKILIIRFSSIGDIVLASPVFRCVKQQLPDAKVHLLTKESFRKVTEANPYVDQFFYFKDDLKNLIVKLKEENYDVVIDLHDNLRSNKIKRALKKKAFTIDKLSWPKFLLTNFNINRMPGRHITLRSLDTVQALGVKDDGLGLDYFIPEKDRVFADDLPTSHQAGFIALVIGATYFTKKLPLHQLQELCRLIDHPIVLVGGSEDQQMGEAVRQVDTGKIYNACGKFNLNESADIVRQSKLVISHDTGMQYIAVALQKQVIAIWGGTSPKLDVAPYYGSAGKNKEGEMYDNFLLDIRCQPCSRYGTDKCPLEHFDCMEKLSMAKIAERVMKRLGR